MKKCLVVLLCLLCVLHYGLGYGESKFDFLNPKWGTSMEEIIAIQGEPSDKGIDMLTYEDFDFFGKRPTVIFHFQNNKLSEIYAGEIGEFEKIFADFYDIHEFLEKEYGESEKGFIWEKEKNLFSNEKGFLLGYSRASALWVSKNTKIAGTLKMIDERLLLSFLLEPNNSN